MVNIKVYTTPTCPWCRLLKDYLRENRIEFVEIDVAADRKAAEEMVGKSGQLGVPQLEINGRMIIGFNRQEIDAEIAKLRKV